DCRGGARTSYGGRNLGRVAIKLGRVSSNLSVLSAPAMLRVRLGSLSIESMPTYDYRCSNGHDFERFFRKISDGAAELECPVCGALAARRVSGGAGLVFKGSGFYLTVYGKNAHRKGAA